MRKIVSVFAVIVSFAAASAFAVPTATYNPATGNIKLSNDTGANLSNIFLQSTAGTITGQPSAVAGSTLDNGDVPVALTYLVFPVGEFDLGNIITPGTDKSDLSLAYFRQFGVTPQETGAVVLAPAVPEPATVGLAGMALIGLGSRRRRA